MSSWLGHGDSPRLSPRSAQPAAEPLIAPADAVYIAAAERHGTALLTADVRIERSGALIICDIITVARFEEAAWLSCTPAIRAW